LTKRAKECNIAKPSLDGLSVSSGPRGWKTGEHIPKKSHLMVMAMPWTKASDIFGSVEESSSPGLAFPDGAVSGGQLDGAASAPQPQSQVHRRV